MKKLLIAFLVIFMVAGVASAETITFDDFTEPVGYNIYYGYAGFDWRNAGYAAQSKYPDSGYDHGIVSPDYCAVNPGALDFTMYRSDHSLFNFVSAYLTAAWNTGLNIDIVGYLNDSVIYSTHVVVDTLGPTLFIFNYVGIDKLVLSSYGGTVYDPENGSGEQFALDNLTYTLGSTVPEPSTFVLAALGLGGLAFMRRRMRR